MTGGKSEEGKKVNCFIPFLYTEILYLYIAHIP
jgi:hypothetical protein